MGDRLATIDMDWKLGVCPFLGELDPHLTQRGLGRGLLSSQAGFWSIQPFAATDMNWKLGSCAPSFFWAGAKSPSSTMWSWLRLPPHQVESWSIQPFGHNRHGPKTGSCAHFLGGGAQWSPYLAQCGLGRGLPLYQVATWFIQPFGHNRYGPKIRDYPLWGGAAGSPSNTIWPGSRPTCMPSLILIHPSVWPQYTNVTDRQTGQTTVQ